MHTAGLSGRGKIDFVFAGDWILGRHWLDPQDLLTVTAHMQGEQFDCFSALLCHVFKRTLNRIEHTVRSVKTRMKFGRNRMKRGRCELQGVEWWHTDHNWERTDMGWPVVPWSLREILLYVQDSSIRYLYAEKLQV